jgi:redox-regulated HSP33 family molecular chaperone
MNSAKLNEALNEAMTIEGALGVALVDFENGMTLGTQGGGPIDLEVAAAGNTEVVRSKMKVVRQLGLQDRIEDILITLGTQFHLIRLLKGSDSLFIYLTLQKDKANLGMAKFQLSTIDKKLA